MDLQKDDYLEVELLNKKQSLSFLSQVIDRAGDWIAITVPDDQSGVFTTGASLKIVFSKKDDALYECRTKIVAPVAGGDSLRGSQSFYYIKVKAPTAVLRNQRRSYVRVSVRIGVDLLYFYDEGVPVTAFTVNSIDLSAEGVRVETPMPLESGVRLMVALLLPQLNGVEEICSHAEVVRSELIVPPEPGSLATYGTALKFIRIPQINMKKILKFVYKQQELQAKSLI